MGFSIVPYGGDSPFRPFPHLNGKLLLAKSGSRIKGGLFFYDSVPGNPAPGDKAAPLVVLIHGLGDEADSWRHIIPLLGARGYRVLAPDLPGFGRSAARGRIGLKNHAAAVLSLVEAAAPDTETPVFLAGNSMGALVAEISGLKKPAPGRRPVRGLVLVDGSIPGGPRSPGLAALAKMVFSRKWYRAYAGNPEAAWASLYPYYADLDALPKEDREFLRRRVMTRVQSRTQERAYFAAQNSLIGTYMTAAAFARKIRQYEGRILLLWGEKDGIMPRPSAEIFRTLRGGARLEIIPGAGHLPQQEKPAETARLMADFIREFK